MGNSSSQEEINCVGYRVLGVQPHSPASDCGLVSFFDFIIAANGIPLRTLDTTFIDLIKASEDIILPLTVYNWKSSTTREVSLIPSRNWPGEGMLGITIRFDSFLNAEDHICHVTDVEPNSPADLGGLQPEKDFILGTSEKDFKDVDALFEELNANIHKTIEFYVYNTITDEVRTVVIMPSNEWGGEGILGAGVASGYLHRIPSENRATLGRASDGYFKSSANSPFGSNLPPVPSSPPKIPYSSIENKHHIPHNHSHQSTSKTSQLNHLTTPEDSNPIPPLPSTSVAVEPSMMSLEDCEKLALEMKSTVMKLDQSEVQDFQSNGGSGYGENDV